MTARFTDPESVADAIIAQVGRNVVLALPLGLGKANHIANALYARAAEDRSIRLRIITALTLEKPRPKNELEKRFISPVIDRLFGGYPDLAYARALRERTLPPNIEVAEFFFLAGAWLHIADAQRNYISTNYTHAFRYVLDRGINVVAQLVAKRGDDYSFSCNPDMTLDLLKARAAGQAKFILAAEVNSELPFMPGSSVVGADTFSHILDSPQYDFPLFAPPAEPVSLSKYATGLRIARLVPDGGTLQIGIGQIGDALAQSLVLRHERNADFRRVAAAMGPSAPYDHQAPFAQGLYGVSEMIFPAFLELIEHGILTREVAGKVLHAAFFLGPKDFYRTLRELPAATLSRIEMVAVSFTNQLHGGEEEKARARTGGRFVNSAMMATLMGAIVSDGLDDGSVVSGVGGQHDFVTQAFALPDARAIITIDATRLSQGVPKSNVIWNYANTTIPRHLRDIVVSEYGVADLRGRSDHAVIEAMLNIADSRFQGELLRAAKDAGKVAKNYQIPRAYRDNTPARIAKTLKLFRDEGLLPEFPFGTDFTDVEQRLIPALLRLKTASIQPFRFVPLLLAGLSVASDDEAPLARMGLTRPASLRERVYRLLLRGALKKL
jgi:acyl-CoA hydrolase